MNILSLIAAKALKGGGGGGGTSDYDNLSNRPKVNDNILTGNKSGSDLGLVDKSAIITSFDNTVTNDQIVGAKLVKDELEKRVPYLTLTVSVENETEVVPSVDIKLYYVQGGSKALVETKHFDGNDLIFKVLPNTNIILEGSADTTVFLATTDKLETLFVQDGTFTFHYFSLGRTPEGVQTALDLGVAQQLLSVGDQIIEKYTYNGQEYDCPWDVRGFVQKKLSDGRTVDTVWLQMHYANPYDMKFDTEGEVATEETAEDGVYYIGKVGSTYSLLNLETGATVPYGDYDTIYRSSINNTDAVRYGYNNYKLSRIRMWLNSKLTAGAWFVKSHVGQTNDSNADGFMSHFRQGFLDCLGEVEVKVKCNNPTDGGRVDTMYDKFYLPSGTNENRQNVADEGPVMPYWSGFSQKADFIRYDLTNHNSARYCWFRSPHTGTAGLVYFCSTDGNFNYYYYANYANRCAPACHIIPSN